MFLKTFKGALEHLCRSIHEELCLSDADKAKLLSKIKDLTTYATSPQTVETKAETKGIIATLSEHARHAGDVVKFADTFTKYSSTLLEFFQI